MTRDKIAVFLVCRFHTKVARILRSQMHHVLKFVYPFVDDHLYINCGGESVSVNGNVYEADVHENGGSTFFMSNNSNWGYSSMGTFLWAIRNRYTINDVCEVHTGDAELYGTARLSSISLKYYGFCLVPGTYKVTLHFAEISSRKYRLSHGKTRRVFDVEIQVRYQNHLVDPYANI